MQSRFILSLPLLLITFSAWAQLNLPDFSPEGRLSQKVGYTTINIRYERPAVRGRKIFGDLVPYQTLWRTGAGKCTTIQFDQPVWINNQKINAGIYALLSIPGEKEWTVLLNTDTSKIYGAPYEYDVKTEASRFTAIPKSSDRFYESFSIDLDLKNYQVYLYLTWENTTVSFVIHTNTTEVVDQHIKDVLAKNPNDHEVLGSIGYYYKMNQEDLHEVLTYFNRALAIQEDPWYYREKVETLFALNMKAEAQQTIDTAIRFLKKSKKPEWKEVENNFEEMKKKL
jgi:hypothetical protein